MIPAADDPERSTRAAARKGCPHRAVRQGLSALAGKATALRLRRAGPSGLPVLRAVQAGIQPASGLARFTPLPGAGLAARCVRTGAVATAHPSGRPDP